ncbi:MAG TPA: Lrp/AsnC family transcriptional regulator [Nitrososphaerales archaeon]|nr:Lrp/AsnC family transcriptional regulator [Nitrososphaerales archaeon]
MSRRKAMVVDELDMLILGELSLNPKVTFRDLARKAMVDQRTVAKRVESMEKDGALKFTVSIDWSKIGVGAMAYVGSSTTIGEKTIANFLEYVRGDPRVVQAFETIGAHQYVLRVLEEDLPRLRETVLRELEPLTAELTTSVATLSVKDPGDFKFLRYLRETRFPRTRTYEWGESQVSA